LAVRHPGGSISAITVSSHLTLSTCGLVNSISVWRFTAGRTLRAFCHLYSRRCRCVWRCAVVVRGRRPGWWLRTRVCLRSSVARRSLLYRPSSGGMVLGYCRPERTILPLRACLLRTAVYVAVGLAFFMVLLLVRQTRATAASSFASVPDGIKWLGPCALRKSDTFPCEYLARLRLPPQRTATNTCTGTACSTLAHRLFFFSRWWRRTVYAVNRMTTRTGLFAALSILPDGRWRGNSTFTGRCGNMPHTHTLLLLPLTISI
jgi:hypothetical protein